LAIAKGMCLILSDGRASSRHGSNALSKGARPKASSPIEPNRANGSVGQFKFAQSRPRALGNFIERLRVSGSMKFLWACGRKKA
jgi:hypothetical protein